MFQQLHAFLPCSIGATADVPRGIRVVRFVADFDYPTVHVASEKFKINARDVPATGQLFLREEGEYQRQGPRTLEPATPCAIPRGVLRPVVFLQTGAPVGPGSLRHFAQLLINAIIGAFRKFDTGYILLAFASGTIRHRLRECYSNG